MATLELGQLAILPVPFHRKTFCCAYTEGHCPVPVGDLHQFVAEPANVRPVPY
ncbi:hypothetical protein BDW71DRAFT_173005 [Aspergillus fruticulosus]